MYATRMTLAVSDISFAYPKGKVVLSDVSIQVPEGEVVVLVGPSGCGKSTLLHCIAGLLQPSSGFIVVDGVDVTNKKPHERGIGIMMQDQPLYEHMTVAQNIAFPLRALGAKASMAEILEQLELNTIATKKVSECSGGERRRVAFGRAVIKKPNVLLLDEPFISLHDYLCTTMKKYIQHSKISTLLVTHKHDDIVMSKTIKMEKL